MKITVIYGPPATGKTTNADRFRQHYCCRRIHDDWDMPARHGFSRRPELVDGDLILTNLPPAEVEASLPERLRGRARLISITEARRACGLGPTPRNART